MNLGKNILKLRKEHKLSQENLAELIGVSRQTISNWELGETSPNPEQLKLLSKNLNISIDELLDNNVKEILVEKVSNTERLAGIIIKILKIAGILFISLIIIDLLALIIFTVVKKNHTIYNEKTTVSLNCTLNNEEYNYIVEYDNNDNIITNEGDKFIEDILKDKEFEYGTSMIKYIESYFKNNGGAC